MKQKIFDKIKKNVKVVLRKCALFTDCIREINNTQVNNSKDIDVVMLMYNLIESSNNYSKASVSLWQYCRDEPALNNGDIAEFDANKATSDSFKLKEKIIGQTGNNGTKDVEIMVPLKYVSNFWRTLGMSLINYKINVILTWSVNCVTKFTAIDQEHLK